MKKTLKIFGKLLLTIIVARFLTRTGLIFLLFYVVVGKELIQLVLNKVLKQDLAAKVSKPFAALKIISGEYPEYKAFKILPTLKKYWSWVLCKEKAESK